MKKIFLSLSVLAASLFAQIDINTASISELANIKGIGEVKAKAIVDYRKAHGKFKSLEDLKNVKGVSSAIIYNIKNDIKDKALKSKSEKVKKDVKSSKKTMQDKATKVKNDTKKDLKNKSMKTKKDLKEKKETKAQNK